MYAINELKGPVEQLIAGNALIVAALMVVLVLVIVYMLWSRESFMPTSTMRMQQNDNVLVESKEHAVGAPNASGKPVSYFAKAVQSTGGGNFSYDPNVAAGAPGSLGYQILNSPDFNCATRVPVSSDAWAWMQGVASGENFEATKNDAQLSALLAGY